METLKLQWKSVKQGYRKTRRKYIELKRWGKQKLRIPFYPIYAICFIIEQITQGHLPVLDRHMFLMDSWLERNLYYQIRNKYKGRIIPQHPLGPYWIDLALPEYMLAIELDGYKYHSSPKQREHDQRRDTYMFRQGWTVMRFTYTDVQNRMADVLHQIESYTHQRDQVKQEMKLKVEEEKVPEFVKHHLRQIELKKAETIVPEFLKRHIK
ncbi:endonuclease domain-containing protein [Hazenella coriacea]|nr:DUF559 domain-containing protein [Hazenella coriacea]